MIAIVQNPSSTSEARRLKELERENGELKKALAQSLLKNRGLEAVFDFADYLYERKRANNRVINKLRQIWNNVEPARALSVGEPAVRHYLDSLTWNLFMKN